MTIFTVLSDIHANHQALLAVARDARKLARHERAKDLVFVSLGDVVDNGPQPNECVTWIQRHAAVTIQGNHDRLATEPLTNPALAIDRNLWPILLWTRAALTNGHKQTLCSWHDQQRQPALLEDFTVFHSDIDESDTYITNPRTARRTLRQLPTPYGLFGHTHMQGYFTQTNQAIGEGIAIAANQLPDVRPTSIQLVALDEWVPLPARSQRVILNPGSVGQPHQQLWYSATASERDYRAAYMLLRQRPDHSWEARFRRVDYPVEQTVDLLRQLVRWDSQHFIGDDLEIPPSDHPFAKEFREAIAVMDMLLPPLVDLLIKQLIPPEVTW